MEIKFFKLENGELINLFNVVSVYRANGDYWLQTVRSVESISESDFNRLYKFITQ